MAGQNHLKQTELSSTATILIEAFGQWVNTTTEWRKIQDGLYLCADPKLEDQLNILRMERIIPHNALSIRVLRLTSSGKGAPIFTKTGSVSCILPLRGPDPTVSGQVVPIGYAITFEGPVMLYPPMDVLTHTFQNEEEWIEQREALNEADK
ncbi:hypothetical protein BU16DRAFT_558382 [Lophium mytilinum]|uniref:Uncharacterized protein n=1 Tax=Lophium mytilinum TaxID=390894 RepID=A0A6A6R1D6_9PEZI|nr:hypothetical protein BU16DRAFT_558382 [Lophium mytilinum]